MDIKGFIRRMKLLSNTNNKIDFVITWVDNSDENWVAEKEYYAQKNSGDKRKQRFRNWDNLKYWFRGVEKYAPWVRKIHFVTCGHLPSWLNTDNEKIHIVNHKDFMPSEYLPTFNCNAIEMNLHRIKDLSENFVYFNDDMFVLNKIDEEYFFHHGKPCDMMAFQPIVANKDDTVMPYMLLNNSMVITKYFDKRQCIKNSMGSFFNIKYPFMYFCYNILEITFPRFTSFYTVHGPSPMCKKTFEELWQKEYSVMNKTSLNKFRSRDDVMQYLIREWQKLKGDFYPKNITKKFKYYNLEDKDQKIVKDIKEQKYNIICINDSNIELEFEKVRDDIISAFECIFPDKSSFEK